MTPARIKGLLFALEPSRVTQADASLREAVTVARMQKASPFERRAQASLPGLARR